MGKPERLYSDANGMLTTPETGEDNDSSIVIPAHR
jgi:hypothetical protein